MYFVIGVTYVEVMWSLQWISGMVTEGHPFGGVRLGTVEVLRSECSEGEGQRLNAVAAICRIVLPELSCLLCAYKEKHLKFQYSWSSNCVAAIKKNPKPLEG